MFLAVNQRVQSNQFELVAIANSSGLISTNVFREKDEPKYVLALAVSAAFGGLCLVLVAGVGIWMRWENARRNREQGVNWVSQTLPCISFTKLIRAPRHRRMYLLLSSRKARSIPVSAMYCNVLTNFFHDYRLVS